jgi:hypothetical protein
MGEDIRWPRKTRELHNHHFDSTIWNDLVFRDDDIIIATSVAEMSPWLDLRVPPKDVKLPLVEAQTHRRSLTAADSAEYEARAEAELGKECARWLATGEGTC